MKILFICTHNRCRSILAEAICNYYGDGLIEAFSAGSNPAEQVHALTLAALKNQDIPIRNLNSQSWNDFEYSNIDYVITVCDKAANEACPVWFGKARQVHWGLSDPSIVEGDTENINAAFNQSIAILEHRIKKILNWMGQGLEEDELFNRIKALAEEP